MHAPKVQVEVRVRHDAQSCLKALNRKLTLTLRQTRRMPRLRGISTGIPRRTENAGHIAARKSLAACLRLSVYKLTFTRYAFPRSLRTTGSYFIEAEENSLMKNKCGTTRRLVNDTSESQSVRQWGEKRGIREGTEGLVVADCFNTSSALSTPPYLHWKALASVKNRRPGHLIN
jgi:hypothetical protein